MKRWKTLVKALSAVAIACAVGGISFAPAFAQDPGPQPRPGPSTQTDCYPPGSQCVVTTPEGHFAVPAPNTITNLLQTVYSDNFTDLGFDMPNTLPSTPQVPYNLISNMVNGQVPTIKVDPTSPTDDLTNAFNNILAAAQNNNSIDGTDIHFAIDILEGNSIKSRPTYSGIPMLHYNGPMKVKAVAPIYENGVLVGGNVNVHQIWFDSHIESDTSMIDPSAVQNVPWTITYKVDILDRGDDDFSPYVMYFSDPPCATSSSQTCNPTQPGVFGKPHVAMDQTFYPMHPGTEMTFQIPQSLGEYWSLVYTWGWRRHPPRVQVMENALKKVSDGAVSMTLPQWEQSVFGTCPTCSKKQKAQAIAMIGDLSPAKRMWNDMQSALIDNSPSKIIPIVQDAQQALADWRDRNQLPTGVTADPNADVTLFYVNNTIYGNQLRFDKWITRPAVFHVTLLNGDYFEHGYVNVDFGGSRGWENTFQSTTSDTAGGVIGGSGCWFTFGRDDWWINAGGPWGAIDIPPASGTTLGEENVQINLNFEPSPRLRLYQFDPMHHDEAIYSLH
jgi:hypothetical protein